MNRARLSVLILGFGAACATAQEGSPVDSIRILPPNHMIEGLAADGSDHRFAVFYLPDEKELAAGVGATVPLVEGRFRSTRIQIGIGASIQTRLDPGQSIAVLSTEFTVDFVIVDLEISANDFLRLGIGHSSHHAGDGLLQRDPLFRVIDVSRDYVRAMYVRTLPATRGSLYIGLNHAYHLVIERPVPRPWAIQAGACVRFLHVSQGAALYAASDVKVRQELSWGTTQRYETGLEIRSGNGRVVRIALAAEAGFDERGQFHGIRQRDLGISAVIEL